MVEAERSLMRPTSSVALVDDLPRELNADQVAELIKQTDLTIVDCRAANDVFPVFLNARRVRTSPMLLRRFQNGKCAFFKLFPQLVDHRPLVVIVADDESKSLVKTITHELENQKARVFHFRGSTTKFAENYPELIGSKGQENEAPLPSSGLNFDLMDDETPGEHKRRRSSDSPSHILCNVLLGNNETAKNREVLKKFGITHVINVTKNLPNYFDQDPEMNYFRIPVDDNCYAYSLPEYFPAAMRFIDKARAKNAAVLVHCLAGISRSATVCLAYFIYDQRSTLDRAFDQLHKQNASIAPNFQFMTALKRWEHEILQTTDPDSDPTISGGSQSSSACSSA